MNSLVCVICHAGIIVEPIHVGDLQGFRRDDVVCGWECSESAVYESHNLAVGPGCDGELCRCDTCWREARRQAHAAIARH